MRFDDEVGIQVGCQLPVGDVVCDLLMNRFRRRVQGSAERSTEIGVAVGDDGCYSSQRSRDCGKHHIRRVLGTARSMVRIRRSGVHTAGA